MKFIVKGISFFKEELTTIPIKNFKVGSICQGHIFIFIGDKPFLMLAAGDYIDGPFLQKYMDRGVESFWFLEVTDDQIIQKYQGLFSSLKNSKTKFLQQLSSENFYRCYVEDFVLSKEVSFLNLIIASYNSFYRFDHGTALKIHHTSTILFNRSLICSTHVVLACLANGFNDYKFVQDVYNLAFILDIGLTNGKFTYALERACESERTRPGSGPSIIESLTKNPLEKDRFFNHPIFSMQFAESMLDKFNYPELIQILKFHHEKTDGTGFPYGLFYSSISSWECLLSYADIITEFKAWTYKKDDGAELVLAVNQYLKKMKSVTNLPIWKIANNIKQVIKWTEDTIQKEMNENKNTEDAA